MTSGLALTGGFSHEPIGGSSWTDRYDEVLMRTFGRPQRVLVRGEGCQVWDADGRRYLDLLAGLAVNSLGHAHPLVVSTVAAQVATLGHVSNFFASPPQIVLAERLLGLVGRDTSSRRGRKMTGAPVGRGRVFLTNSGTEAVEAAFKIARRTGRTKIVAAEGGFHGRTMGALALTGKAAIREPFEPLPAGVVHVSFGDVDALAAAVDDDTAAVVLEPIQGEAGVRPAPQGYLTAAREIASAHGALLVLDEIQTGIGRTGDWFAFQAEGVEPDVVTLAKGLAGGFPIGACVALGAAAELLGPGSHGSTFGGNPLAAATGLAVLQAIEEDELLGNVTAVGDALTNGIRDLGHPSITGVRGRGLLLGIELSAPLAQAATLAALDAGFIVNAVAPDVIRLAPPLILTSAQARRFVTALPAILDTAGARQGSS